MSYHQLVLAPTGVGKSHLIRYVMTLARRGGPTLAPRGVLLFDPAGDSTWRDVADFITDDPEELERWVLFEALRCEIPIDDAYLMLEKETSKYHSMIRKGRHRGHRFWVISTDWTSVHAKTRRQCSVLWASCLEPYEAQMAERKMRSPGLADAINQTNERVFVRAERLKPPQLVRIGR